MKVKVIKFIVTPIYAIMDDDGLVTGEGEGPAFPFYPGSPFNINETVKQAEEIITKRLGVSEQMGLLNAVDTTELRTQ